MTWELKQGDLLDENPGEEELLTLVNSFIIDERKKTSSYKFGFLKSILDNLFSVQKMNDGNDIMATTNFDKETIYISFESFASSLYLINNLS